MDFDLIDTSKTKFPETSTIFIDPLEYELSGLLNECLVRKPAMPEFSFFLVTSCYMFRAKTRHNEDLCQDLLNF